MKKVKLKLTRHAVSYKIELHPAKLERNISFRCTFSRVLQSVFPDAVPLHRTLFYFVLPSTDIFQRRSQYENLFSAIGRF